MRSLIEEEEEEEIVFPRENRGGPFKEMVNRKEFERSLFIVLVTSQYVRNSSAVCRRQAESRNQQAQPRDFLTCGPVAQRDLLV